MLIMILEYEIIVISLKNVEALRIGIVMSISNEITKFSQRVFPNLKKNRFHLVMQELGKFNLKINFVLNRLET